MIRWTVTHWTSASVSINHYGKSYTVLAPTDRWGWETATSCSSLAKARAFAATKMSKREVLEEAEYRARHKGVACKIKQDNTAIHQDLWWVEVAGKGAVYARVRTLAAAKQFALNGATLLALHADDIVPREIS